MFELCLGRWARAAGRAARAHSLAKHTTFAFLLGRSGAHRAYIAVWPGFVFNELEAICHAQAAELQGNESRSFRAVVLVQECFSGLVEACSADAARPREATAGTHPSTPLMMMGCPR